MQSTIKEKQKFALFILDDMVEYLGPEILGDKFPQIAQKILEYTSN